MPQLLSAQAYIDGILNQDISLLSRAITLVESSNEEHQNLAFKIMEGCLPHSGNSIRVGITGVPGVGKSTFIEALGNHLTNQAHRVAVLAVDPSSQRSKGSILGDKTRMESLASNLKAYVRPSPSSGSLGGITATTREAMILCEAAGFDITLIETVGVGQSETEVADTVDFFMLLMLAGAGDELQGIKRGIMEMADGLIINKAEGENLRAANQAAQQYRSALHLFPPNPSGWVPRVATCSALNNTGVNEAWQIVTDYVTQLKDRGGLQPKRHEQLKKWFHKAVEQELKRQFLHHPQRENDMTRLEEAVVAEKISPMAAARQLLAT